MRTEDRARHTEQLAKLMQFDHFISGKTLNGFMARRESRFGQGGLAFPKLDADLSYTLSVSLGVDNRIFDAHGNARRLSDNLSMMIADIRDNLGSDIAPPDNEVLGEMMGECTNDVHDKIYAEFDEASMLSLSNWIREVASDNEIGNRKMIIEFGRYIEASKTLEKGVENNPLFEELLEEVFTGDPSYFMKGDLKSLLVDAKRDMADQEKEFFALMMSNDNLWAKVAQTEQQYHELIDTYDVDGAIFEEDLEHEHSDLVRKVENPQESLVFS